AIQNLMASEVYNMDLSNAQPNKPFTLTLKYDKERALNTGSLRIYQYDAATGLWKELPGNYTVDPMSGVVSVDVASLDYAYEGAEFASTPLGRKKFKMSSVKNGRYVPSAASSSQTGQFAVFTAKPGTGVAYTGASFEVYNMPNPFNLKNKTVTISADGGAALAAGAHTVKGTILKYHLPAGKAGSLKFVIYNLAGEKVRTLDEGSRPGGEVYYSEWDGKNDAGKDCASGVYFMLTYLDGKKLGTKVHKMAIIK
ncbi:MAG TPA: FlgD immunoglobulin-like domain containing protein, partial [Elusimicrobiales bacterium]|nr:FlgD immunoglobulin-like domain containing protein [Elusimicrobiales bacterium]